MPLTFRFKRQEVSKSRENRLKFPAIQELTNLAVLTPVANSRTGMVAAKEKLGNFGTKFPNGMSLQC